MSLTYSLRTPYVRHARCEDHFDTNRPGYIVDFNHPVREYLDARSQKLQPSDSQLHWTKECVPNYYRSTKALNQYKTLETLRIEHEIDQKTSGILAKLRQTKRPPFDEKPSDDSSLVTKNTHPDDIGQKTHKRIEYLNQRQFDDMIKHDTMEIVQRISKLELDNAELPREVERQVRHIYNRVLPETERAIQESDADVCQAESMGSGRSNRPIYNSYMNTIDGRRAEKLFKQVGSSLHDAKQLLLKLDDRIECDFYKCSLDSKCWVCRKVVRNNSKLHYYSPLRYHRMNSKQKQECNMKS